ncbi:hypothetical protein Tco_0063913 [Tanacetum coccineum]
MLANRRYAQWQSRFLRYIDTRPNGDALRKCILEWPYIPSIVRNTPLYLHRMILQEDPERTAETKRAKDYTYHKEKMLLCKQAEKDSGTDTEPLEQVQYDAEYNVFTNKRQHYEQPGSINNTCVVEKADSNIIPNSPDMCNNEIQTD